MRLPLIKQVVGFINDNDEDYIQETIEVLENFCDAKGIKDEELDVLGEVLSTLYGALEVIQLKKSQDITEKEALNLFMKRVIKAVN